MLLGGFFFWIALCIIVAIAANTRGRSPLGWFVCALLISPLLGGLWMLALPKREVIKVGPIYTEGWIEERRRRRAIVTWIAAIVLIGAATSIIAWLIFLG
jgi:hypothetical protein